MPPKSRAIPSRRLLARIGFTALTLVAAAAVEAKPRTLGWLEWGWLEPGHVIVKSKLDTGARTSSIHAEDIEAFERDEELWVRFRIPLAARPDDSDHGRDLVLERRVVREITIKDHVLEGSTRYAVNLELCIGGMTFTTPVTLADRSRFNYPLLLGRVALAGRARVDPAKTFTASDSCPHHDDK